MKEKIYKILYFFCVSVFIFVSVFNVSSIVSGATIPSTQIVVAHQGTWSNYVFDYSATGNYYTIQDSTGISNSTYLAPTYFVTYDHVTFHAISGIDAFTTILNYVVGVVVDPSLLDSIYGNFCSAINITDNETNKYMQNGLYNSNDDFLGYCLNDISGCHYSSAQPQAITYPDYYSDDVNNYYRYYERSTDVDYFNVACIPQATALGNYQNNANVINYFNNNLSNNTNYINCFYSYRYSYYQFEGNSTNRILTIPQNSCGISTLANQNFTDFCQHYSITTGSTLGYSQLLVDRTYNTLLTYFLYDSLGSKITSFDQIQGDSQSNNSVSFTSSFKLGNEISSSRIYFPVNGSFTIYKDSTTLTSIKTQTYNQTTYVTDSYNNYDTTQDNSIEVSPTVVSQAVTNNSLIYQASNDSFYEYVDNSYIDNSSITNNTTNITNNYYQSGGGNDPDDPNNPDDPDDNDTLEAILRAILRFFNAIGDIIGTILASILNLIDSVLEALAGVMENLTGMSDFFASLFAWIPEPVPQILGAGFGICFLCGLIKFIRG